MRGIWHYSVMLLNKFRKNSLLIFSFFFNEEDKFWTAQSAKKGAVILEPQDLIQTNFKNYVVQMKDLHVLINTLLVTLKTVGLHILHPSHQPSLGHPDDEEHMWWDTSGLPISCVGNTHLSKCFTAANNLLSKWGQVGSCHHPNLLSSMVSL